MVKDKEIKVIIHGEITFEAKKNYAKALARALMYQYGKDTCEKILEEIKLNREKS